MKKFDDEVIDLTVTSPPYDNLRNYKGFDFPFEDIAKELYRVTKQGGVVVWVVNDATIEGNETGTSFNQALYFREIGFNLHDTMIFRKTNPIPQIYRKRYNNEFEFMFVFSKGTVKTHNPLMIDCLHAGLELNGTTYKNFSKNEQTREKLAKPVKDKKIKGNIWEYVVGKKQEDQEAKGHPAPFPCGLVRDHIKSWTNQGDIVFDPMSGSGTVARVATEMGRQYIGVDISHEYCDIARKRVRQIENAPTLFFVEEPQEKYTEETEEAQPQNVSGKHMDAKSAYFTGSESGSSEKTTAIVPLVSENKETGELFFIGTAFYISNAGLLMTAKHNLFYNKDKVFDNLGVFHFLPNNAYILRPIRKLAYANGIDIAYLLPDGILNKEKVSVSSPCLILTNTQPKFDEQLGMYGYPNSRIEKINNIPEAHFNSEFYLGKCREYHKEGFSLLRNPCYQTTINIKSGASGGPVFDSKGHVFALSSTGIDLCDGGENISFVTPISPSFGLILEDGAGNKYSIQELIDKKHIPFEENASN